VTKTLYARISATNDAKIRAAAQADGRSVANWVDTHFTYFFAVEDTPCSSPPPSFSDRSSSAFQPSSDSRRPALPTLTDPFAIRPATPA